MHPDIIFPPLIFLYGIIIGSFLNVCIYRIPRKENITTTRSHCMNCGYSLKWYDLFPLFSYIFLGGKCRKCKKRISIQYPIIEALNGSLYVLIFLIHGYRLESIIYCLFTSALIVLSVIDFRTYEIPVGINLFIGVLGSFRTFLDFPHIGQYLLGLCSVSGFLLLIYLFTKGRGIGGGDIKLMAASGLVIGFPNIVLAFILGCIIGSVIHILRMRISKEDRVLAFGPYLSIGIFIAMLYGNQIVNWYLSFY
ncbi:leader peptidase (prepilin peptidase)/N-methyltransferase [Mobilisporobacter senegalensis]|uniref:Leader peptidase (Prepilin peptidase)/N-methyltransferase n=1 Tax=Mobilisporobacter senegalensis TaxID=1329262 RepID=A0A3N1Y081_9FIRM|nr:A24 family peptidase [Mobilisporobacter senegalensis]ROR30637.1 leader peptidase (prepilin peptidase)/N-methyltransferase [Mobilisporobacter senegalensis]